jgi:hypothetical protein
MTSLAIELDQPQSFRLAARLLRVMRLLAARRRLGRYPSRRRAASAHTEAWIAGYLDNQR